MSTSCTCTLTLLSILNEINEVTTNFTNVAAVYLVVIFVMCCYHSLPCRKSGESSRLTLLPTGFHRIANLQPERIDLGISTNFTVDVRNLGCHRGKMGRRWLCKFVSSVCGNLTGISSGTVKSDDVFARIPINLTDARNERVGKKWWKSFCVQQFPPHDLSFLV